MSEFRDTKNVSLSGIDRVSIFNPAGKIQVIGWEKQDLRLETIIKTEENNSDNLIPLIEREDSKLIIRAPETAKNNPAIDGTQISPENILNKFHKTEKHGLDIQEIIGNFVSFATRFSNHSKSRVNISMIIHLPKTMNIQIKNHNGVISVSDLVSNVNAVGINGPISLCNIEGQVTAQTVNGPVSIENSRISNLKLKTVNGPLKCYLTELTGQVGLQSVNGSIRMALPDDASVNMCITTMMGSIKISSEFIPNLRTSRKICCVLNNGDHNTNIKTSTGSVTITTFSPKNIVKESPQSLIDRMVADGKINEKEAQKLRCAL